VRRPAASAGLRRSAPIRCGGLAESIESLRRTSIEVVDLPTLKLDPDPANPNRVPEKLMDALRRDVLKRGFVQPVLVRPNGDRYTIIDGEHRWRVLRSLESEVTPCVIDEGDDDAARMRMLTMNKLRGRFAPVKLANILADLAKELNEEELRERLGMDEEELEAALQLQGSEDAEARLARAIAREEATAPVVMRWRMGPRQAQEVEAAINRLAAEKGSRAEALIALLA
jgi:ParB/RepB/Spo0J family partition protein